MLVRPEDVDDADIADAIARFWGLEVTELSYAPVGFGAHHWTATDARSRRWFVTLDDLHSKPWLGHESDATFIGLASAYDSAARLRDQGGLPFVLAPTRDSRGAVANRLGERWSVCITPQADGLAGQFGDVLTAQESDGLARALAALHATRQPPSMPHAQGPDEQRRPVRRLLSSLDRPWSAGPWSDAAFTWCVDHASDIEALLRRHDDLSAGLEPAAPVVTHGEPHPGNLIKTGRREAPLLLIDWDTIALARPERDIWLAAGGSAGAVDLEFIARYESYAEREVDPAALELARVAWVLTDVVSFASELRGPHEPNQQSEAAWALLRGLDLRSS